MKKALMLIVTIGLILFYTLTATAATTVYLDQMSSGTVNYDVKDENSNSTSSIIGFESMGERFKFGGELESGSYESAPTTDFTMIELTGGVWLINKKHFKIDAQITYQSNELKSTDSADYSGIMCGVDMIMGSERSNMDFSFMLPVSGTTNDFDFKYKEIRLLSTQIKYNCLFTEHMGLSIGYRYSEIIGIFDDGYTVTNKGITYSGDV